MTVPAQAPVRRFADIEEAFALLRTAGNRVTMPCRIVLESLFAAAGPISAAEIARTTALADSDLSSIYRNLERLESLGIVAHVHLGHGPSLYRLVGTGEKEFLVCERCDRVTCVDPAELDLVRGQIEAGFGYRARFSHFPIVGLCAACAGAAAPPAASSERLAR